MFSRKKKKFHNQTVTYKRLFSETERCDKGTILIYFNFCLIFIVIDAFQMLYTVYLFENTFS